MGRDSLTNLEGNRKAIKLISNAVGSSYQIKSLLLVLVTWFILLGTLVGFSSHQTNEGVGFSENLGPDVVLAVAQLRGIQLKDGL